MPEYLAPGVYVEERETGAMPIEGVGTSTAGFVGMTERGPVAPQYVTSNAEFQRLYGDPIEESYLAHAIEGFFQNGGSRCYVARVSATQDRATATLDDGSNDLLTVTANGPGEWGGRVGLLVDEASLGAADTFKLTVRYWRELADPSGAPTTGAQGDPDHEEVYDDLSYVRTSSNFYETVINERSALIDVAKQGDGAPPTDADTFLSLASTPTATVSRSDYQGQDTASGQRTGLASFKEIDEIAIVCVPDEVKRSDPDLSGLSGDVLAHCEGMEDRVAVLQTRREATLTEMQPGNDTPVSQKGFAAVYAPWVKVYDRRTNQRVAVPPGGHVAGVYARSDAERGVHKAPANEQLRGVDELDRNFTKGDQETLNPKGVNCIRSFRGRGIVVWGARTTSPNPLWKYLNVRRLFLYLEESIDEGTQWAVFEPNDERLWARVRQSISNFLTTAWRDGALMGTTPEEAFYVTCDRTTMTQDDIDNGRLIVEIGVAPVKPAEFVVFRISQWTGGTEGRQ